MSGPVLAPPFAAEDADRAFDEWGANCGPGALAGILCMTLEEVRPHLGDFEAKGYTNPTLMYAALKSLGVPFRKLPPREWPSFGLVRVQWEGPWTEPGVPMRARYRYTHWIGTALRGDERGVFDINCMNNGAGWVTLADWERVVVPWLLQDYPRASGSWHIANGLQLDLVVARG